MLAYQEALNQINTVTQGNKGVTKLAILIYRVVHMLFDLGFTVSIVFNDSEFLDYRDNEFVKDWLKYQYRVVAVKLFRDISSNGRQTFRSDRLNKALACGLFLGFKQVPIPTALLHHFSQNRSRDL